MPEESTTVQCQGQYHLAGLTLSVHLASDIVTIRTIVTGVQGGEPFAFPVGGRATTNLIMYNGGIMVDL